MEFIKDKYFFWGIFTGFLWTTFGVILIVYFLSEVPIEDSIEYLYQQGRLGGVISLAALINLPLFLFHYARIRFPLPLEL